METAIKTCLGDLNYNYIWIEIRNTWSRQKVVLACCIAFAKFIMIYPRLVPFYTVSDSFYLRGEIHPWDAFLYLVSFDIYRIALYSFSHKYSWRKCKKKVNTGPWIIISCQQINIFTMGLPLGSTLNNSVFLHYENWCLNNSLYNLNWTITAALLSK